MSADTTSEKEPKLVTFLSKYRQHRIVRKGSYSKEVDGQRVTIPGTSIQFEDGVYTTSDPEELAFLRSQKDFTRTFTEVPKGISDIAAHQAANGKSLEEREAELKKREEDLAAREKELTDAEKGKGNGEKVELEKLDKKALLKMAKELGIDKVNAQTAPSDLIALIKAKQEETPSFN